MKDLNELNPISAKQRKIKYINKYNKKNYKQLILHLSYVFDKEMIEFLQTKESKNSYIKNLIKADMERRDHYASN